MSESFEELFGARGKLPTEEWQKGSFVHGSFQLSSSKGCTILLRDRASKLIAAGAVQISEAPFPGDGVSAGAGEPQHKAAEITGLWLRSGAGDEALAAILYLTLRRGRMGGAEYFVFSGGDAEGTYLHMSGAETYEISTPDGAAQVHSQDVNFAMQRVFQYAGSNWQILLADHMADEAAETVRAWVAEFFQGPWAQSILNGTISRRQYVECLENMHHYVRQTTGHLGRLVGWSSERELRNHFIRHLQGEINHEALIESDLRALDIDPHYLMYDRVPSVDTKLFMSVQEACVTFSRDPVVMMACPLVAEGITAHMDGRFLESLLGQISSWGISDPAKAARFLSSHTHFDGGDDGHWQATVQMLRKHLRSEKLMQEFLCVMHAASRTLGGSFDKSVRKWSVLSKVAVTARA